LRETEVSQSPAKPCPVVAAVKPGSGNPLYLKG